MRDVSLFLTRHEKGSSTKRNNGREGEGGNAREGACEPLCGRLVQE